MSEDVGTFGAAAKRLAERRKEEKAGIFECVVCGIKNDIDGIIITKKYKKYLCQTHLAIEENERKILREAKKAQKVDLSDLVEKIKNPIIEELSGMKEMLIAVASTGVKEELLNELKPMLQNFLTEIKRSFDKDAILTEGSLLRRIWESKSKHILLSRLVGFYGASNEEDIKALLEKMSKYRNIVDVRGNALGKLLWKNGHGWYLLNPNIPQELFETLAGERVSEEKYKGFIKMTINRATKGKERELFKEYLGQVGKRKWFVATIKKEVLEMCKT